MCSSFRLGQDNLSQKAGSFFFFFSKTKLCYAVKRSVRDFHSGRKSGKHMLIFKYRVDLDFPSVRRFCLEEDGKSIPRWLRNNAFTYFKSEREPEVKLPFKLEPVRPQELP